jgi:hypothetical protein
MDAVTDHTVRSGFENVVSATNSLSFGFMVLVMTLGLVLGAGLGGIISSMGKLHTKLNRLNDRLGELIEVLKKYNNGPS